MGRRIELSKQEELHPHLNREVKSTAMLSSAIIMKRATVYSVHYHWQGNGSIILMPHIETTLAYAFAFERHNESFRLRNSNTHTCHSLHFNCSVLLVERKAIPRPSMTARYLASELEAGYSRVPFTQAITYEIFHANK